MQLLTCSFCHAFDLPKCYPFFWLRGRFDPLRGFGHFVNVICPRNERISTRSRRHDLKKRFRARGSRRVVAAHLCAHEWNSWIRWRCAVDSAARRARRRNDLISSPFDRASRILCERFGGAARRQSFARSDRESRKFEFASADNYIRDGGAELHRHGLSQEDGAPRTD